MGCINVEVSLVQESLEEIVSNIENSFAVSINNASQHLPISVTNSHSPLLITVIDLGNSLAEVITLHNSPISTSVSIVCSTTLGIDEFLEVIEGRLFALENGYLKVLKENVSP